MHPTELPPTRELIYNKGIEVVKAPSRILDVHVCDSFLLRLFNMFKCFPLIFTDCFCCLVHVFMSVLVLFSSFYVQTVHSKKNN